MWKFTSGTDSFWVDDGKFHENSYVVLFPEGSASGIGNSLESRKIIISAAARLRKACISTKLEDRKVQPSLSNAVMQC